MKTIEGNDELLDIIEKNVNENLDFDVADKIYAAIGEIIIDKKTKTGNAHKSFTNLAYAVAMFLKMLTQRVNKTAYPHPCTDLAEMFVAHLEFFSETFDMEDDAELPN